MLDLSSVNNLGQELERTCNEVKWLENRLAIFESFVNDEMLQQDLLDYISDSYQVKNKEVADVILDCLYDLYENDD